MKHWEESKSPYSKTPCLTLLSDDSFYNVLDIYKDGENVVFMEGCDSYYFSTKTKEEAIEALEELINYIKENF